MLQHTTPMVLILGSLALVMFAVPGQSQSTPAERTTESGLKIIEVKKQADAMVAQTGDLVWVHYTGKLQSNGKKFDSSIDRGPNEPIVFKIGAVNIIQGWNEGIAGMKVGEKRQLIIPPSLAYKEEGRPPVIPPNSTLVFDVELVGIYRQ